MLYSLYLYSLSIIVTGYYSIEYSRIKMNKYQRWFLLNMVLPIVPFIIKVFIFSMSNKGIIELSKIAELPELVFFSIYICVIGLNVNFDGKIGKFESILRLLLYCIILLDCVTLGMIYSKNIGSNIIFYMFFATILPSLIAPIYKFWYFRETVN